MTNKKLASAKKAPVLPRVVSSLQERHLPGDGSQVPGLQLVNDVSLQHNGFAGRDLLPQQVSHRGGEL